MIIAGIGSQQTPLVICEQMRLVGEWCLHNGVTVRSGHARGADYAFERGAKLACQVFLPWASFNKDLVLMGVPIYPPMGLSEEDGLLRNRLNELVLAYHPVPRRLSPHAFALHRRNGAQVLGARCDQPANAITCWTPNAAVTGGTGQALRVAAAYEVPVVNMAHPEYGSAELVIRRLRELLSLP